MRKLIIGITAVVMLSACGDDPLIRISETLDQEPSEQWVDRNDQPNYPEYQSDALAARRYWNGLTPNEKEHVCREFWNYSDDELTDRAMDAGASLMEVNALLNLLWRNC